MLRFKYKTMSLCLILLFILCLLTACGSSNNSSGNDTQQQTQEQSQTQEQPQGAKTLLIGTASPGGNWYTAGAKLAKELEALFPGVAVGSGPGGAITNVVAVNDGKEMQLGMTTADVQLQGFKGMPPFFEKANSNIRFVGTVETMLWQMVVPEDSDIKTIQDLANKRINPGKVGWGDRAFAETLFKAYDITFDSISKNGGVVHGLGFDDAAEMMQDGQLDCTMTKGAIMPFIINLDTRPGVRFIPLEGPEIDKLLTQPEMAGWTKGVLKKGTYDGLQEDVPTLAITTTIIGNANMPDDEVYKITKAIYESGFQTDVFQASDQKGFPKACSLSAVPECATIPVHPGAKKYFDEKGIVLPQN
ncbi:MAG: TAXI family TRAP transporter solute-binding subunit [Dehalobacterium sp.]